MRAIKQNAGRTVKRILIVGFLFFILQYPSRSEISLQADYKLLKYSNLQGLTCKKSFGLKGRSLPKSLALLVHW